MRLGGEIERNSVKEKRVQRSPKRRAAKAQPSRASANGSADGVRLQIAMDALEDISAIPRSGRAGRLAKAVLRFLQHVKPVSFGVGFINPPNHRAARPHP
jgi:hypothetical protein